MSLVSGVSRQLINPNKPLGLFGYPHTPRISTGIHDPLFASALYLENHHQAVFMVSVDVLMLDQQFLNGCRQEIADLTNVPSSHVLISTTHTHSAPVTMQVLAFQEDQYVPPPDPDYMGLLHTAIVSSAVNALKAAAPASIAVSSIQVHGVGRNRHDPDGPRDPEVGVLAVKSLGTDQLIALSLVYCMHPTVLHEDSTLVSADFPGLARSLLEDRFPGMIVLYHTGPAGNQSPRYDVTGQTFQEASRLGSILADGVFDALQKIPGMDFNPQPVLGAIRQYITLPRRKFPGVEEAQMKLKTARDHYQELVMQGAPHGPRRTAEVSVFGAEEMVILAKMQQSGQLDQILEKYRQVELQVIRIGEVYVAALQGEIFVEYGLEIKRNAHQRVFIISLANGELQGYIVTPGATGYEADFSLFSPQSGSLMVSTILEMILKLSQEDKF